MVQGLKSMSGVAGSGGKYWSCLYSLAASSMLKWYVRSACGRQGMAHSVVSEVVLAKLVWIRA